MLTDDRVSGTIQMRKYQTIFRSSCARPTRLALAYPGSPKTNSIAFSVIYQQVGCERRAPHWLRCVTLAARSAVWVTTSRRTARQRSNQIEFLLVCLVDKWSGVWWELAQYVRPEQVSTEEKRKSQFLQVSGPADDIHFCYYQDWLLQLFKETNWIEWRKKRLA